MRNKKNNIIFVSYASGTYKKNIFWNKFFVRLFIRPKLTLFYTDDDLKVSSEYTQNKHIFDTKTGAGYWAWKPWAISEAFKLANEGDIVIYQDCGKGLRYKNFVQPSFLIDYAEKYNVMPGVLVPEHGINLDWTHKKCFEKMNCDSKKYHNSPQVEATISFWEVNQKTKKILQEWKAYCIDEDIISDKNLDSNSGYGNKGHRYDQSILTNLVIKYNLIPIQPEYLGLHMFKSISLLEMHLKKEQYLFRVLFSILSKVILFKRRLLKTIRL